MTKYEEITGKLMAMGASKTQATAKVVPMMLAMLENEDEAHVLYGAFSELAKANEEKEIELEQREAKVSQREELVAKRESEILMKTSNLKDFKDKVLAEIRAAEEDATRFETPEARDKIRLANMYRHIFENIAQTMPGRVPTEFLTGLASILKDSTKNGEEL